MRKFNIGVFFMLLALVSLISETLYFKYNQIKYSLKYDILIIILFFIGLIFAENKKRK